MINDDAAGGLRGTRATHSPELLDAVRQSYGIASSTDVIDLGGSSSLNLRLDANNDTYVLRVHRPYVTTGRLNDIHVARSNLAAGGVPVPEVVPTLEGRPWIIFDGRLVEIERYVEHDADMDSWERLKTGLQILGRIHSILRNVEVGFEGKTPRFANYIEPTVALNQTLRGTKRIRAWDPSPAEVQLADHAEELARALSSAEQDLVGQLPKQLVHGDFWDNNVLFRDGGVVLVTDFDFMGKRTRTDDLALTLYFASLEDPENPVSDDQLQRLRGLVEAYDTGLDDPLSKTERAALPFAIARQPLWSIGVWVATLDDEGAAREHTRSTSYEVGWALGIVREVDRWQAAFA